MCEHCVGIRLASHGGPTRFLNMLKTLHQLFDQWSDVVLRYLFFCDLRISIYD